MPHNWHPSERAKRCILRLLWGGNYFTETISTSPSCFQIYQNIHHWYLWFGSHTDYQKNLMLYFDSFLCIYLKLNLFWAFFSAIIISVLTAQYFWIITPFGTKIWNKVSKWNTIHNSALILILCNERNLIWN